MRACVRACARACARTRMSVTACLSVFFPFSRARYDQLANLRCQAESELVSQALSALARQAPVLLAERDRLTAETSRRRDFQRSEWRVPDPFFSVGVSRAVQQLHAAPIIHMSEQRSLGINI